MLPTIRSTFVDEEENFTFHVLAYRPLTPEELQRALEVWLKLSRRKKVPRNKTVEVLTIAGFDE